MRVQRRPSWKGGEGRLLVCMHMRVRGFLGCGVSVSLDLAVSLCMGCGGDCGDTNGGNGHNGISGSSGNTSGSSWGGNTVGEIHSNSNQSWSLSNAHCSDGNSN